MTPADDERRRAARLRRLGSNALSLLAAYVLPRVFTLAAIVLAARVLGADRFGAYGAAAAFAVILSIIATLGMHSLLVRDLARSPESAPRLVRAAHLLKTVSNLAMLALLYALARWVVGLEGEAMTAALLLGLAYAIGAYAENFSAYYQAVERMHVWTEASALLGVVTGGLGAVLVVTTRSVGWFALAPVAGQFVALGWLLRRAPPEVRHGAPAALDEVLALARALAPFAVAFIFLTLHYKLDVLLVRHWRTEADVGLYTAAYKFVDLFHALVLVAVGAMYPWLARSADPRGGPPAGMPRASWASGRAAELALLAAVPAAGALHLAAVGAVRLAFGAQYAAAAPALSWLAIAMPALALNLLGGYLLGAAHRMDRVTVLYATGLVLKTALDALLVPRFAATGAAAAMAGAETVLAALMFVSLARLSVATPRSRPMVAVLIAAALVLPARLVTDATGGVLVAVGYLAAVAAVYAAVGVVHPQQRRVLGLALRRSEVATEAP
jgi:O-antigen/teichoic acid export membrane protein